MASGGPGGGTDVAIESGLRALHQGDFAQATAGFEQAVLASPGAPVPLFFVVFSRWWQRVFGEAPASEADPAFDQGVESTLKAARERLERAPGEAPALAALGGAQVLRSHLEAVRGNYFRSGQEARRGKKALDRALAIDGDLDIALFPAGALNYYADRVPLVVKGLRPLFFFPGGDAPLGLSQIRRVAEGRGAFRTDGRLLLAQICSDRYQRSYRESLAHFRLALQENPGSPLINAAIGDLQIRLGEYSDATTTLTTAVEAATGDGPERSRQRQWLRLGLAEARLGEWKIDEAEESLRRALQGPVPLSPSLSRTAKRLEEELAQKRAAAPLLAKPSDSRETSVMPAALAEEIRRKPDAPLPLYLRGKALLLAGRAEEALESLREAARSADGAPAWLSGWIEIESGDAEARLGHLKEARAHYRRAAGLRRFRAADRGRLKLEEKGEDAAACAAPAGS
jgi:tetratricopeptide (TPR) repeat protein